MDRDQVPDELWSLAGVGSRLLMGCEHRRCHENRRDVTTRRLATARIRRLQK